MEREIVIETDRLTDRQADIENNTYRYFTCVVWEVDV